MTLPTTFRTPYEIRVDLVKDIVLAHSKLGDNNAEALAVQILHVLGSIPEKMR